MTLARVTRAAAWLAGATLAAALVSEGLVRALRPQVLQRDVPELWVPDPALGWRNRPNAHVVANTGERDVEVCTNALGDRVACGVPARTDCAKRVLVLGSSFVEAISVPFDALVWSRLDADTGACSSIAGVAAWAPGQELALLRERLRDSSVHYDVVVAVLYVNGEVVADPDAIPPPREIQHEPLRLLPAGLSLADLRAWFYPANAWLESRSQAYVAARAALRRLRDPGGVGIWGVPAALQRSRLTPELVDGTTRGVREMVEEAHRHGARCLVVLVPHPSQALDPDAATLLRGLPELAGDVDMALPSRVLVPRLEGSGADRVVDLLPALQAHRDPALWGASDGHLSPAGHALWYEVMREPLRELLQ